MMFVLPFILSSPAACGMRHHETKVLSSLWLVKDMKAGQVALEDGISLVIGKKPRGLSLIHAKEVAEFNSF